VLKQLKISYLYFGAFKLFMKIVSPSKLSFFDSVLQLSHFFDKWQMLG